MGTQHCINKDIEGKNQSIYILIFYGPVSTNAQQTDATGLRPSFGSWQLFCMWDWLSWIELTKIGLSRFSDLL